MPDPSDLCLLADVKAWSNINETASDTVIARLITAASRYITTWLGRPLLAMVYNETRDGSGTDAMPFRHAPAFNVNSLTIDTIAVQAAATALMSGYSFDEDRIKLQGQIVGQGQNLGAFWITRFAEARSNVIINYSAGYALPNQVNPADWSATAAVAAGATILPASNNAGAFAFVCTRAGTTGGVRPQFNQTAGALTTDGTAIWATLGVTALPWTLPDGTTSALPPDLTQACIELCALRIAERGHIGIVSQTMGGQQTLGYVRGPMPPSVIDMLKPYREVAPAY